MVYHNQGDGHFAAISPGFSAIGNAQLNSSGITHLWCDFNSDGYLDLILRRFDVFQWRDALYRGDGHGGFSETPVPWAGSFLAWGDFDHDGIPDLLQSTGTRQDLRVLRNLGGGSFASWGANLQTNFTPDSVAVGDFDNDGDLDVLSSGYVGDFNYVTRLFRGQADGSWKPVDTPLLDFKFATASWADVDNDGDLDLLINGQRDQAPLQGYSTLLYRNDQPTSNTPPVAPGGLKAFFTTNSLILTWQPATDSNQSGGLTYNVRVGTSPAGLDVLSPMSAPNGYRMVPRPGNAGWLTRKVINGAQRGQSYYWSVQAVDNSYAGSPFAMEARTCCKVTTCRSRWSHWPIKP